MGAVFGTLPLPQTEAAGSTHAVQVPVSREKPALQVSSTVVLVQVAASGRQSVQPSAPAAAANLPAPQATQPALEGATFV